MSSNVKRLTRIGVIAGVYIALTYLTYTFSFTEIQVRVAEALTVLPFIYPEAVWGVTIGCFLSNITSPFGPIDMILGTSFTLIAALLTRALAKTKKPYLAPLPPIIINAFGVSLYVTALAGLLGPKGLTISKAATFAYIFKHFRFLPYITGVAWIGIGEAIATYGLGLPLLYTLIRKEKKNEN